MDAIRIRNLRSFTDNDEENQLYASIKPLTIFIGKNSCGKSSLLRVLPLLKQSNNERVTAPISWFGKQVDFGSFKQAKSNNAKKNKIYFDFIFNLDYVISDDDFMKEIDIIPRENKFNIEVKVGLTEKEERTIHDTVTITFNNHLKIKLKIKLLEDESIVNISTKNNNFDLKDARIETGQLIPSLYIREGLNDIFFRYSEKPIDQIKKECIAKIKAKSKNTKKTNIFQALTQIGLCDFNHFERLFSIAFNKNKTILKEFESDIDFRHTLYELHTLSYLSEILSICHSNLKDEINGIRYIGPIRASAERYYRHEELYIDEIDPKGDNLPLFLSRLTHRESLEFNKWTTKYFDFSVRSEQVTLHHQIKIKLGTDHEQNISDMGFGFSQILPIVVSLWHEMRDLEGNAPFHFNPFDRMNRGSIKTFVIEQPELHLHPQYQSLLAKTFAQLISYIYIRNGELIKVSKNKKIRIIFETHSQTMIDAIGYEVEKNNKLLELVNILIFNKDNGKTKITESKFDEDGDLVNWPVGFFSGK